MAGPIVRINPEEVHIADSDFYDTVYIGNQAGRKIDKWPFSARFFGNPGSMISTIPHDHHRLRRQPLNPYFSKQAIRNLEPVLYQSIDKVLQQTRSCVDAGSVLNLSDMFSAFTGDVIMDYAFGQNLGFLDDLNVQNDWHALWVNLTASGALVKQVPLFGTMLRVMPPWMAEKMDERFRLLGALFNVRHLTAAVDLSGLTHIQVLRKQVLQIKDEGAKSRDASKSIMRELIDCDLPDYEKTLPRLVDEGQSVVGAGTITTAEMMSAMLYHLLNEPELMSNLQNELQPVMQRTNGRPSQNDLEPLPYLTAVIKEGLRLYYGISQRLPRIHNANVQYKDTVIPQGTPMSMSSMMMHTDPAIFPDPQSFKPDRWLSSKGVRLDNYLVPFGKGTRQCLGINLAWAEMYLLVANMCAPGRFNFALYETDLSDVKVEHDFFVAFPRLDTKGVRVTVK